MTNNPQGVSPIFRIDVSAESSSDNEVNDTKLIIALLQQLVANQEKSNHLLEQVVEQSNLAQKQRANELGQWKEANPHLARGCRSAAETLSRVQTQFLRNLIEEIMDHEESLLDGEFMLNEFVDRFGPRLAHLNGVLQVLSQLSSIPSPTNQTQQ